MQILLFSLLVWLVWFSTNPINLLQLFHGFVNPNKYLGTVKQSDIIGNITMLNLSYVFYNRLDCAWKLLYKVWGDTITNWLASLLKFFR